MRFDLFALVTRLFTIPCGTSVVTRRGVKVFTCVDVISMLLGLVVICLLRMSAFSGLVFCSFLLFLMSLLVLNVCVLCYAQGFCRARFQLVCSGTMVGSVFNCTD